MIRNTGSAFGGRPIGSVFLIYLINIHGYSLYMDDIWIISWFNHTAFDANPIWKSPSIAAPVQARTRFSCVRLIGIFRVLISSCLL